MQTYVNPVRSEWPQLLQRPYSETSAELTERVAAVLKQVRTEGDKALLALTERFDGVRLESLKVSAAELAEASSQLSPELKEAIGTARANIEKFHAAQRSTGLEVETQPGVVCRRKQVAIESVGLYIPGGSAPLFSTLLMLGVPAVLAGCRNITLCSPPDKTGKLHPAILYTAHLLGLTEVYKVGGSQAIAAMAYGTESIPKASKIFGPGNQYVTAAKQLVSAQGTAIDMPAGPSEVLVIATEGADAAFVAADLLSQAEHGPDSQVILVSDSAARVESIVAEVNRQVQVLPRRDIAQQALANSRAFVLPSLQDLIDLSNLYAPEHLILAGKDTDVDWLADRVTNAGSVFMGNWAPESVGDYASGTNHTLPTNGFASAYSGVSLDSFCKQITFQRLTPEGLRKLGPVVERMADAEQLFAHKNAVTLRLNALKR